MRPTSSVAISVSLGLGWALTAGPAGALTCDLENPNNVSGIAAVRATIASTCDCGSDRLTHLACARNILASQALIPRECERNVRRCVRESTCGRPGAVTCCRQMASGDTGCRIKRDPAHCTAPADGSAYIGSFSSCCDACAEGTCVPSPTVSPTPASNLACCQLGPFCATLPPGHPGDCTIQGGFLILGAVCYLSNDPGCPVPGSCGACGPAPSPTP